MTKNVSVKQSESIALERIKRLAITAMFSDDMLLDALVLKGGNAMALIHKLTSRASMDLDFSMKEDFPDGRNGLLARIEPALRTTFRDGGYEVFDLKMGEQPNKAPAKDNDPLADFWGGYKIEFKLVTQTIYKDHKDEIEKLRKFAIHIGNSPKFEIDISRFEYIEDKEQENVDGYRIYVYSPLMIACEKLRAICQQLPDYGPIVMRAGRPGSPRARDFFDIYILVERFKLDMTSEKALDMLQQMFAMKRVPMDFLDLISGQRDFHATGAKSLEDTISPDEDIESFDFYFNYVMGVRDAIQVKLRQKQLEHIDAIP